MDIKAAGILIFNNKGELLVLHRKSHVPEGNKWGLPGGRVSEGRSFAETAVLKTEQEIGLDFNVESLRHLETFKFLAEENNVTYEVWIAETTFKSNSQIDLNHEGHDSYKWDKPEKLLRQKDLMVGMYPILEKVLQIKK